MCSVCRVRAGTKRRLLVQRCGGAGTKWANDDGQPMPGRRATLNLAAEPSRKHTLRKSGNVIWCGTCGSLAETKAVQLASHCRGPPPSRLGSGGLRQQFVALRAGTHPVSGQQLPPTTRMDGTPIGATIGYARLAGTGTLNRDELFREYVPEVFPTACPVAGGANAKMKERLRLGRIRLKEGSQQRRMRMAARKVREQQADQVIATFGRDESEDEDGEARRFWEELACSPVAVGSSAVADRLAHVGSLDQVVDQGWRQGCRAADRVSRLKLLQANLG